MTRLSDVIIFDKFNILLPGHCTSKSVVPSVQRQIRRPRQFSGLRKQ